jgi:hypothetical protein
MAKTTLPSSLAIAHGAELRPNAEIAEEMGVGCTNSFLTRDKYCHNGGMAFAQHHGVGFTGSTMAIMAPAGGPLKMAGLQEKSRRVRGSAPFGGRNGLECLSRREKYCHNGGMAFAPH